MQRLSLEYIVREPAVGTAGARPPLLLLLHGIGSNEQDLFGLTPALDPRFLIASLRAPITLQGGAYAWYHTQFLPSGYIIDEAAAEQSRQGLLKFIDEIVKARGVDDQRVFLMGFSQGCIMSIAAALTAPRKFAGIVGMSGRLLPGVESKITPKQELRGLPVLLVHGKADSVIPVSYGHQMRDDLQGLGVDVTYIEYPMAHNISRETLDDVARWLTARLDDKHDWRASGAQ